MVFRTEVIGDATLILADCCEAIPSIGSFQLAVTSPPYGAIRDYGGHEGPDLYGCLRALSNGLSNGGVIMWNTADQSIDGSETGESFRQALFAKDELGLRLHDTMIYCKEGVTFPDAGRYFPAFEYMFVFSKGAPTSFNGIKDRVNKWARTTTHGTKRLPDGSARPGETVGFKKADIEAYGLRHNWWIINPSKNGEAMGHPAPMPFAMADAHVQTWSDPGDIVVDPFMGSGTTGVAALRLGRRFIGIEIHQEYFDKACRRIEQAHQQPTLFEATV